METYSIHKGAQIAPRKARMTLDLIRGKKVSQAEAILLTTNTKASRLIIKVLNSAVANAVNNFGADKENLVIKETYITVEKPPNFIIKTYKFGYEIDNPSFQFLRHKIFLEPNNGTIQETFYTLNLENSKNFFKPTFVPS